jgi:hypothetical protein
MREEREIDNYQVTSKMDEFYAACCKDDALKQRFLADPHAILAEHAMDPMNTLIAACWKDDALKQRFLADPHAILAEHGMDVPEGINVKVIVDGDLSHYVLPLNWWEQRIALWRKGVEDIYLILLITKEKKRKLA